MSSVSRNFKTWFIADSSMHTISKRSSCTWNLLLNLKTWFFLKATMRRKTSMRSKWGRNTTNLFNLQQKIARILLGRFLKSLETLIPRVSKRKWSQRINLLNSFCIFMVQSLSRWLGQASMSYCWLVSLWADAASSRSLTLCQRILKQYSQDS